MENVNLFSGKSVLGARRKSTGGKKLPIGIHEGVTLEPATMGDNYFDIHVSNEAGEVQNKRIWFPDENKIYVKQDETFEEAVKRDTLDRLEHLVSLVEVAWDKEVAEGIQAGSFKEFCEIVLELVNKKEGMKINVKLIYDKAGDYSEFPYFTPYLEKHVEGQKPTLRFSKYELEKRMTPNPTLQSDKAVLPGAANDIKNVL